MNAVEIEQAISALAAEAFDPVEFPTAFLEAFGVKANTVKAIRAGRDNKSDVGGVLYRKNIHLGIADLGQTDTVLGQLRDSPASAKWKVRFILATDGETLQAEDLETGETVACEYPDFPNHFGFFLPLAGISPVKQIKDNAFDIRATSRLNRLYLELLKDNPDWAAADKRHQMNQFMARLIFCFFAEDTYIFNERGMFSGTVEQMSSRDSSNTHEVIGELFRSMDTPIKQRESEKIPRWADPFPYVNGGLFAGGPAVPRFSKISRSYLLHIGGLDWTKINPDIFGSMIQAITEDEERGALGMHYTSVPNILKVLDPLFLDDLREKLEEAGDNPRTLLNLRKRIARIRVFDPACGSGNFLVIAYKQMRAIENTINERRGEPGRKSDIPLTNFRGIELRDFSAEVARLALIIAEYQCDLEYLGQREALREFLPLKKENWIICGNALRLDWLSICPPTGTGVKVVGNDLFSTPLEQTEIDFENEGGETYICGNPPYLGSTWQSAEQKGDLKTIFDHRCKTWKSLDYVSGWLMKAADYGTRTSTTAAFVSTNSVCQGQQVAILWPLIFDLGFSIVFAHTSFKWANLASNKAGVTVVIVGVSNLSHRVKRLFTSHESGVAHERIVSDINAYLISGPNVLVNKSSLAINGCEEMDFGSKPVDEGNLFLSLAEKNKLTRKYPSAAGLVRPYTNSEEFINGKQRFCLWIEDKQIEQALNIEEIRDRINRVAEFRRASKKAATRADADRSHRFSEIRHRISKYTTVVPRVSSENRPFLPVGVLEGGVIIGDRNFALYDAPLWNMALIASRLHWVWIGTVCVRLEMRFSYSNTLGWNTFPVPTLTEKNKADLTRCAEDILLAREAHFPVTIADLYDPDNMPANLREAHERNDEVLERIYIGRRFKNDTERLEKLFELYTKMVSKTTPANKSRAKVNA